MARVDESAVAVRGISFGPAMLSAIVRGKKRVTRRPADASKPCRFRVGDRLYCREALERTVDGLVCFRRDYALALQEGAHLGTRAPAPWTWKVSTLPAMYMPRRFARVFLRVTTVERQRLHAIGVDALRVTAEGFRDVDAFRAYWDELYALSPGKRWDANPLVDVISFVVEA